MLQLEEKRDRENTLTNSGYIETMMCLQLSNTNQKTLLRISLS